MTGTLFLSVVDTAAAFGVSDDLVYELIARGELPAAEFGRRKMVPKLAVDTVIERLMDGFDPDALIVRLAATAGPSTGGFPSATAGGPTGPTGPTATEPHSARSHRRSAGTGAPTAAVR